MIKNLFDSIKFKNPELGDYIILCMAIQGKKYSQAMIRKAFLQLVSKDEYDASEKDDYIKYLYTV